MVNASQAQPELSFNNQTENSVFGVMSNDGEKQTVSAGDSIRQQMAGLA